MALECTAMTLGKNLSYKEAKKEAEEILKALDENKICMCPTKKILTPALGLCIKNCLSMPNFPGISKTIA